MKRKLAFYSPLLLNGDVTKANDRKEILQKFNAPDLKHRVLIISPQVGGIGVSLDDKDGRFPRRMHIVPSHNFLDMYQSAGRLYRRGMKSDSWVDFVYANNASLEQVLVSTLAKSVIADLVLKPGSGRTFPGAYDINIEDYDPQVHYELKRTVEDLRKQTLLEMKTRNQALTQ